MHHVEIISLHDRSAAICTCDDYVPIECFGKDRSVQARKNARVHIEEFTALYEAQELQREAAYRVLAGTPSPPPYEAPVLLEGQHPVIFCPDCGFEFDTGDNLHFEGTFIDCLNPEIQHEWIVYYYGENLAWLFEPDFSGPFSPR